MKSGVRNAAILLSLFSVVFLAWAAVAAESTDGGPWIGVYSQAIDKDLKDAFDLDRTDGILIVDVMKGSPAEKAGLHRRDIIIKFNGKAVDGTTPLTDLVGDTKPGDRIDLVYIRNGEEKSTVVEVGTRDSSKGTVLAITPNRTPSSGSRSYGRTFHMDTESDSYIGVGIQDLGDQLGSYFGVPDGNGVLITEVTKDSPAEKAGLKAGDVVVGVDRKKVASSEDLQGIISDKKKGDMITVNILRDREKKDIQVEVGEDTGGIHALTLPNMPTQLPSLPQFKWYGGQSGDAGNSDEIKELREEIKQLRHELEDLKDKIK